MKSLLLLRHAKSEMGESRLNDFDRKLAPRGREAAAEIGLWLAENSLFSDLALVSTAPRAQETWGIIAPHAGSRAEIRHDRALYLATPGEILAALAPVDRSVQRIIVVGHNPGLETLAQLLSGPGSETGALANLALGFPTAGLAVFDIGAESWCDIANDTVRLVAFVRPRET